MRYISLRKEFGGSLSEWENMKERDIQNYMIILNSIMRVKKQ
jgi:hypothetical protein